MSKIVIANDHGGVELAKKFSEHLKSKGHNVNWLGVFDSTVSVDYPDMAKKCTQEFKSGNYDFGILVCGTGIGISIAANKEKGIVCALPQNIYASKMAREHNGANFIAFGGRIDYPEDPLKMLDEFLSTQPSIEERHVKRRKALFA